MNLKQLIEGIPIYGKVQILLDYGTEVASVNLYEKHSEDGMLRPMLIEDVPAIGGFTKYEISHMAIASMTGETDVALIPKLEPESIHTMPYVCISLDSRVIEPEE